MITGFLITTGTGLLTWLAGLFPTLTLPSWVTTSVQGLFDFMSTASGLGNWIPWAVIGSVVGFVITWFLAVFGVKLVLLIWSKIPVIGGGS